MREKDEITGLFRSRLSGTEMTVRDGFWEQLQEDAASPAAGRKRAAVLSPKYYRGGSCRIRYICAGSRFGRFLVFLSERGDKGSLYASGCFDAGRQSGRRCGAGIFSIYPSGNPDGAEFRYKTTCRWNSRRHDCPIGN